VLEPVEGEEEVPGAELPRPIRHPLLKIKDEFRAVAAFLKNDERSRGRIVKREGDTI